MEPGGYVEDTLHLEYARTERKLIAENATRAELTVDAHPAAFADLRVTLAGTLYTGATDIPLTRYLPDEAVARLQPPDPQAGLPGTADVLHYRLQDAIWFQEAYAALHGPHFHVRVGRQVYETGNGMAFLALDVLNLRNPLDPSYEVDGLDALVAGADLSDGVGVEGLARLASRFDRADYLVRMHVQRPRWNAAIEYLHHIHHRVDWEAIDSPQGLEAVAGGASLDTFTRLFRWNLFGGEIVGRIGRLALHGEAAWVHVDPVGDEGTLAQAAKDHERIVAGAQYTFGSGVAFMGEYFRFGQGRANPRDIDLNDRLALLAGEIQSADRDNAFLGAVIPLGERAELDPYVLLSLDDPSVLFNPWLTLHLTPVVTLWASAYFPVSRQNGQLGKAGIGGTAKLRVGIPSTRAR